MNPLQQAIPVDMRPPARSAVLVENADPAQGILDLIHPRKFICPQGREARGDIWTPKGVSNPESRGQGQNVNIII